MIGKKTISAAMNTLGIRPKPNQIVSNGAIATMGVTLTGSPAGRSSAPGSAPATSATRARWRRRHRAGNPAARPPASCKPSTREQPRVLVQPLDDAGGRRHQIRLDVLDLDPGLPGREATSARPTSAGSACATQSVAARRRAASGRGHRLRPRVAPRPVGSHARPAASPVLIPARAPAAGRAAGGCSR